MKKYKRISCTFTPTGVMSSLVDDDIVTEELNKKLNAFLKSEKVKAYQIINTETVFTPKNDISSYLVCMHLAYEI